MIERDFDVPLIAGLALREKQIQQNYRPVIAVHKWFARRPGTLFRGLLVSEFVGGRLQDAFYRAHDLRGLRIADPFMGGGGPLIEANRLGCDIVGYDINPMSYWIVRQEIESLDLDQYRLASEKLVRRLEEEIGRYYRTRCLICGSREASVKYFLWVKTMPCEKCGREINLFPGYLISENKRHPRNVLVCADCGDLNEVEDRAHPGRCMKCGNMLTAAGPARRNRCACPHCRAVNSYPRAGNGPPRHRLFAIEYHCPGCKSHHRGRFFKAPDSSDLDLIAQAEAACNSLKPVFIPADQIPRGDETNRLLRWGYKYYREMFNTRQLLGLELSCRFIAEQSEERIRNALATNLSDLLRYQNMLCRYDSMALKSLDIFSVHGFPVGLIQCESNFLGIQKGSNGDNVGSGGWSNITAKFMKAKSYCDRPFEILHRGAKKVIVEIPGEWIGETEGSPTPHRTRKVDLSSADAALATLEPESLDAVLTDPPYFGNVQYAELMDFCFVWLRRIVGKQVTAFAPKTTRNPGELTGNENMGRGLEHFTEGLSSVFRKMALALKRGSPLAFTYHHNTIDAYWPVAVAILDSGLTCSASFPCPAEMGGSIHISGTKSSIIDTVFVCRSTGRISSKWIVGSAKGVAGLVRTDVEDLRQANLIATVGDIRCITFGHLVRLAVWSLRTSWDQSLPTERRLGIVAQWIDSFGNMASIEPYIDDLLSGSPVLQTMAALETQAPFGDIHAQISF